MNNITSIQFVSEFECESCGGKCRNNHEAYIEVEVVCDGVAYRLGTMVGVPEYQLATMRAAGSGMRPFISAWFADSSDWSELPRDNRDLRDAVESALIRESRRLFRDAMDSRPDEQDEDEARIENEREAAVDAYEWSNVAAGNSWEP